MSDTLKTEHGTNYSIVHAGGWKDLRQHIFKHPVLGDTPGKLFLKAPLRLTGLEISMGSIIPGRGTNFTHRHRENEEVYIFVKGRGQMMVDDKVLEVSEGTVVRVGREGARAWRNTGDEPLHYIVVQAKADTMANGTITDGVVVSPQITWKD